MISLKKKHCDPHYTNQAERVAAERCEEAGKTVGYNIRLESQISDCTQVGILFLFCLGAGF